MQAPGTGTGTPGLATLPAGARRTAPTAELRAAVGLRSFRTQVQSGAGAKKKAAKGARLVSFREEDGSFRFRLLDAAGEQLLLSKCFADGKAAGLVSKRLQSGEPLDLREQGENFALWLDTECVAQSPAYADASSLAAAMAGLRDALKPQE